VPKGKKSFLLVLQAQSTQGEFTVLSEQEISSLKSDASIVVFEAVVTLVKEQSLDCLQHYRFSDMVLLQAAQAPPYEPTSTFADIKDSNAVAEILSYRKRATEINSFFVLDHIYLNRLDLELKDG
jgi:hypothetical protein